MVRLSITPISLKPEEMIAGRYRVEKTLGRGGMAVVYQVFDTSTNRRLALKLLTYIEKEKKRESITQLFEHEFHTLSQLAHPRVIEVYDFGVDSNSPYYTMELLDGGDLRGLSPLPWREACSLITDICSALSLLHSRRMVHRDLTPRNIRCHKDGTAKLIDFGAMAPMGSSKHVVGTPAYTSPEAVNHQSLDGRADLYSLGATAYFVLTGREAYPVRSFLELRDFWRNKVIPPSRFIETIPKELDHLVLSLLNLDFMARPVSAAEVMERLSAITGVKTDEKLLVSQSFLSTPLLVGREKPLMHVRKQLVSALRDRGGTIVVRGDVGTGRSRFLDACVLDAKLLAITVVRADATDTHIGSWDVVRTLFDQLLQMLPNIMPSLIKPYLSVLGHIMPSLMETFESPIRKQSEDSVWSDVW